LPREEIAAPCGPEFALHLAVIHAALRNNVHGLIGFLGRGRFRSAPPQRAVFHGRHRVRRNRYDARALVAFGLRFVGFQVLKFRHKIRGSGGVFSF